MWSGREDQDSICSDQCPFHYSAYRQEERGVDRHLVFLNGAHRGCCDSTLRKTHRLGSRFILELAKYFKRTKVPEKCVLLSIVIEIIFELSNYDLASFCGCMNPDIQNPVITE